MDLMNTIALLMFGMVLYFGFTVIYLCGDNVKGNLSFLNPIKIYDTHTKLNWFGTFVLCIVLNAFWLPYALIYWAYKVFYSLMTYGRK